MADWRYIHPRKQVQVEKHVTREKSTRIEHHYRVEDRFMISKNKPFKYKTSFKGLYEIIQTWTNRTFNLRTGSVTYRINTRHIKPHTNNTDTQ